MQIKPIIIETFSRKGYFESSQITKRDFHILMNSFITQTNTHNHSLFNENLTNQIWKQAEERLGKEQGSGGIGKLSAGQSKKTGRGTSSTPRQTPILVQTVISTIVDAIQILTNRVLECQGTSFPLYNQLDRLQQLKQKRQAYQRQQNFLKLEPLQQKIEAIKIDHQQFQTDLKMLTQPFMNDSGKNYLKRQVSIKKKETVGAIANNNSGTRTGDNHNQVGNNQDSDNKTGRALDTADIDYHFAVLPPHSPTSPRQPKATYKQEKNCAFYLLVFLSVLQLTVCMIKYDFVNLIVFLVGFLVLAEDQYLPSMMRIAFWAVFGSIGLDALWLVVYLDNYLHLKLASGVKQGLKPYLQYAWFVTLLQSVIKLILLYFIKSYEIKYTSQHKDQQKRSIHDTYIKQIREKTNELVGKSQQQKENDGQKEKQKLKVVVGKENRRTERK